MFVNKFAKYYLSFRISHQSETIN